MGAARIAAGRRVNKEDIFRISGYYPALFESRAIFICRKGFERSGSDRGTGGN